jgi:hypothetical protein
MFAVRPSQLIVAQHVYPRGSPASLAVGARPPHDGVRRARCLNLFRDLEALPPSGSRWGDWGFSLRTRSLSLRMISQGPRDCDGVY